MGRTKIINDKEILRHARVVFREGGHAASTRDVARAAGISQAVLYQRFGSKEDLFFRAMTPESPNIHELLGRYPPKDTKRDLEDIATRLVEFFVSLMPTLLHVLAHPDLGADRLVHFHAGLPFEPLLNGLSQRIARMRKDKLVSSSNPDAAALAFLAAVHSVAMFETMSKKGSAKRRKSHIVAMVNTLWEGFAPR
jgi:AcrR family transcriptional regulator